MNASWTSPHIGVHRRSSVATSAAARGIVAEMKAAKSNTGSVQAPEFLAVLASQQQLDFHVRSSLM